MRVQIPNGGGVGVGGGLDEVSPSGKTLTNPFSVELCSPTMLKCTPLLT